MASKKVARVERPPSRKRRPEAKPKMPPREVWGPVRCGSISGLSLPALDQLERMFLEMIATADLRSVNGFDPPRFDPRRRRSQYEEAVRRFSAAGLDPLPLLMGAAVYLETLAVIDARAKRSKGAPPRTLSKWIRDYADARRYVEYLRALQDCVAQLRAGKTPELRPLQHRILDADAVLRHASEYHESRRRRARVPYSLNERAALLALNEGRAAARMPALEDGDPEVRASIKSLLQRAKRRPRMAYLIEPRELRYVTPPVSIFVEPDEE